MGQPDTTSVRRGIWALFLTIPLTALGSYFAMPYLQRARMIGRLNSADAAERAAALRYVTLRSASDPRVLRAAFKRAPTLDDRRFLDLVAALDAAGRWRRPTVPDAPWLRWLTLIASGHDPPSRAATAELAGQLTDLADDPAVHDLLARLTADDDADVRQAALLSAAALVGAASDPTALTGMIADRTSDPVRAIAEQAWVLAGLTRTADTLPSSQSAPPDGDVPASTWARLNTQPDDLAPALAHLDDPASTLSSRAAAVYAIALSTHPDAAQRLDRLLPPDPAALEGDDRVLAWRAAVGLAARARADAGTDRRTLTAFLKGATPQDLADPATRGLVLACVYAAAGQTALTDAAPASEPTAWPAAMAEDPMVQLAWLEGLPPSRLEQPDPSYTDRAARPLIRLAALQAASHPQPDAFQDLLAYPDPAMRDAACLLASQRLTGDQLTPLIRSLLADFNDDAKCSGAILAGLTGLEPELLRAKAKHEDVWAVQQVMQLGLWMIDRDPAAARSMATRLTRKDLPTTTFLLGLLHNCRVEALDHLLDPRQGDPDDLLYLLDQCRWWGVLRFYLRQFTERSAETDPPPSPPPPFWYWADPDLQRFQIDVLQSWYLLNRERLRRALRPQPTPK